ncbi:MAG TPA: acyl-CoA dehydrogenase family protein, partial [Acidimicrobiales bacterium]|nr:acyl-CoA dehydrogenase family protein [Acidimicrobiales bacterium]
MHLDLTEPQRALQHELRGYFGALMTEARREALRDGDVGGRAYRDVVRQMGADGWLGVGWPKEYGGQGRSALEQLIFYDEANRAGAPIPLVTLNTVGPTLMRFGSEDQKAYFLPR